MKELPRSGAGKVSAKLASTPSPYRAKARLQIAQIKLYDKQFKDCVELCRDLWKDRADLDTPDLLQIWGTALEGMGDFSKAALCYAGKAPE